MKTVAMVVVLCTSMVFVVNIKDGKKGMYGVNNLNMDTHEHLMNLKVNDTSILKFKLKSTVPLTIENRWYCICKVTHSGVPSIL